MKAIHRSLSGSAQRDKKCEPNTTVPFAPRAEQLQEPQQELSVRRLGRLLPLMLAALSPGKVDGRKSLEESKVCQETSYFYVAGTWFWMFVNVVVAIVWSFMVSAMVTFIGCWLVFYVRDHIEEEQRREHEDSKEKKKLKRFWLKATCVLR